MIKILNNDLIKVARAIINLSGLILIHLVVSRNTKTKQTWVALTCRRKNKDACARMGWHDLEGRGRVHTRLKLPLCLTGLETARPALLRRSGILIPSYEISRAHKDQHLLNPLNFVFVRKFDKISHIYKNK